MEVNLLPSSRVDVANLSLEQVAANSQVSQAEKVHKASQAFEALLLRQILAETQQPVFKSSLVGNSTADGIYRDLVVNQLAESISKSGSLGLAKSLNAQLQRQTTAHAPSSTPAARHEQRALDPSASPPPGLAGTGPAPAVSPSSGSNKHD